MISAQKWVPKEMAPVDHGVDVPVEQNSQAPKPTLQELPVFLLASSHLLPLLPISVDSQ